MNSFRPLLEWIPAPTKLFRTGEIPYVCFRYSVKKILASKKILANAPTPKMKKAACRKSGPRFPVQAAEDLVHLRGFEPRTH